MLQQRTKSYLKLFSHSASLQARIKIISLTITMTPDKTQQLKDPQQQLKQHPCRTRHITWLSQHHMSEGTFSERPWESLGQTAIHFYALSEPPASVQGPKRQGQHSASLQVFGMMLKPLTHQFREKNSTQ